MLFDPAPITVTTDSELPDTAVRIYADTYTAKEVAAAYRDKTAYKVLHSATLTVDGLPAVAYEVENTGKGFYAKGVRQVVVIIDRGAKGTLVMETIGKPSATYDANSATLELMAGSISIDR